MREPYVRLAWAFRGLLMRLPWLDDCMLDALLVEETWPTFRMDLAVFVTVVWLELVVSARRRLKVRCLDRMRYEIRQLEKLFC